jgi:hypothetical protein
MDRERDSGVEVIARRVEAWFSRRRLVQGCAGLALGALGLTTLNYADARTCKKKCKDHCKSRHKRRGSNRQCRHVCQQRCD